MIRAIRLSSLFAALVLFSSAFSATSLQAAEADQQQAVLVTGASTGIGRRITEVLAEQGYYVYAGARKQKDLDALNALDNVQAVKLDVTVQEQIDAAVATVEAGGRGLHGLVNNAGVFIGGPLADVDLDELQWVMDVNVYGVYRVTQAFAPMIIASKGRISTIGSISGTLSGRFSGHYSMTKHAIEAYTDSLAAEMAPLGVHVSVIEPGNYDSAIADTAIARMREKSTGYAKDGSPFAEQFNTWIDRDWDRGKYKAPDEVAEAAVHAMFAVEPLRRYMVVPREEEASRTIGKQIEELVQLNEWQAYSYTRDELVGMLDAVPAAEGDVEDLTATLHHFLAHAADADTHDRFWADDLVYTSSSGDRFGKADIMSGFDEENEGPDVAYSGEDVNVQVFGTSAVVTFKLIGTPSDGSEVKNYFNTGTFLKRGGEWRAIAWQATVVPAT
ncbi:MAG: SDR family NAD(P)-dependent oxidoreductase [Gammaproteobacteria bacterium]|jgi:NAD(P)-dependent dehydrogenase (short-subunit alcohol dehydrogenase family)|nr:SDR family NAD(P)-dependent oxidoreductase [Gammaproteobacteria bacterium]MDH3750375.1 SDR family NAD(P)-dependent oxidoreductase [Gammaproteobacteria bacterium]